MEIDLFARTIYSISDKRVDGSRCNRIVIISSQQIFAFWSEEGHSKEAVVKLCSIGRKRNVSKEQPRQRARGVIYAFQGLRKGKTEPRGGLDFLFPWEEPSKPLLNFTRVNFTVTLPEGSPLTGVHESMDSQNARGTTHTERFGSPPSPDF